MTRPSLREYAAVQRERYLAATRAEKGTLLNEVVTVTGLHRATAERWLEAAVTTARGQSAALFELRATTRLAEVLVSQGREADAARRLGEVYASFTQGHGAPDLEDAKAVLDRVRT